MTLFKAISLSRPRGFRCSNDRFFCIKWVILVFGIYLSLPPFLHIFMLDFPFLYLRESSNFLCIFNQNSQQWSRKDTKSAFSLPPSAACSTAGPSPERRPDSQGTYERGTYFPLKRLRISASQSHHNRHFQAQTTPTHPFSQLAKTLFTTLLTLAVAAAATAVAGRHLPE